MRYKLHIYNDPYLDNALQSFYRFLEDIRREQPSLFELALSPTELVLTINDRARFLDVLEEAIKDGKRNRLTFIRKKGETTTEGWKHFLIFRSQPPSNHPETYREETLRPLLEAAFPQDEGVKTSRTCFLCGERAPKVELTQGVYPFSTKASSLTTAPFLAERSQKTYHSICPLCYLVASLGWMDRAIPYRSRVNIAPRQTVSYLWLPYVSPPSLQKLDELKRNLPSSLDDRGELSNFPLSTPNDRFPPSRYSLLLACLEKVLQDTAEREIRGTEAFIKAIPDEWWNLRIPEGRGMKNLTAVSFAIPLRIKGLLADLISSQLMPYRDIISQMGIISLDKERKDREEERKRTDRLWEGLSYAFLEDNYQDFARFFQPSPRWVIILPGEAERRLYEFIRKWRCSDMFGESEFDILRKAGGTIALISDLRNKPSVLYNFLDRVRTPSDMLDALRELTHLLVGVDFEEEESRYLSPDSLEQLVELVNQSDSRIFPDLKNTLGIFIGMEYAKRKLRERRKA